MPSLVTGTEYSILLIGALFSIGVGVGAAIYHMLRR